MSVSVEAGDVDEPYIEDAPVVPIAMVPGSFYLVRDFGEALGPFEESGEGTEVELYRQAIGGRVICLDATREGIAQLHVYPNAQVSVPLSIMSGLFDTAIRFGYGSLEHNAARKSANNYQIGALHVLAELAKEKAVCVTRIHEEWGKEDRARRAAEADEERSRSICATSVSQNESVHAGLPAIEKASSPPSLDSVSKPKLASSTSTRMPEAWKRKPEAMKKETPSPTCEADRLREEKARRRAEYEAAQGSLFLAHEIAATVKPEALKTKKKRRGQQ